MDLVRPEGYVTGPMPGMRRKESNTYEIKGILTSSVNVRLIFKYIIQKSDSYAFATTTLLQYTELNINMNYYCAGIICYLQNRYSLFSSWILLRALAVIIIVIFQK